MAGGASSTISFPGPGWHINWLDGRLDSLQLDIVGFLAILGEESVKKTTRLAALSRTFYLPRLLPAPHCLLYTERQEHLEAIPAVVTGVQSGNKREAMRHVAAALFPPQMCRSFETRCFRIRQRTTEESGFHPPLIKLAMTAPVNLVNLFGCALSVTLLILSLVYGDGFSLVATVMLSFLSTLVGITNRWTLHFPPRRRKAPPRGDAVIRYPNGSFLVLKMNEDISHELLFAPDSIDYVVKDAMHFIPVSIIGTVTLMLSVIALANATIQLQLAWAGAYILLNVGHWLAAALPRRYNWSFEGYEVEEEHLSTGSKGRTYTEALWRAIFLAGSVQWARDSNATPSTDAWKAWLDQAEAVCQRSTENAATAHPKDEPESQRAPGIRRRGTWSTQTAAAPVIHQMPSWSPRETWRYLAMEDDKKRGEVSER